MDDKPSDDTPFVSTQTASSGDPATSFVSRKARKYGKGHREPIAVGVWGNSQDHALANLARNAEPDCRFQLLLGPCVPREFGSQPPDVLGHYRIGVRLAKTVAE